MPGKREGYAMKIVVIGGTGLIGSKLVTKLAEHGQRWWRQHRTPG
jgi:uncharacterized protein YbjT (DUF2867 family)